MKASGAARTLPVRDILLLTGEKMLAKKLVLLGGLLVLALVLAACGGESGETSSSGGAPNQGEAAAVPVSLGDPKAGKEQYEILCIACHGRGGEGIEGLGKPFTTSEFLREGSDEEMVSFIQIGRSSDDPLNTTGVDMPAKGGNPALTSDQILDIVAYVRTLQK